MKMNILLKMDEDDVKQLNDIYQLLFRMDLVLETALSTTIPMLTTMDNMERTIPLEGQVKRDREKLDKAKKWLGLLPRRFEPDVTFDDGTHTSNMPRG
jgi:hypothetical protein